MNRPDMALYMMWEDPKKEKYKVGIFVQKEDCYYLQMCNEPNLKRATDNGYIGFPGLKAGEILKSPRVFDFIERRIAKTEINNPGQALMDRMGGRSQVDSYFFEPVAKALVEPIIQRVVDSYELQQKLKEMNARNDFE